MCLYFIGAVIQKLEALLRLLNRGLSVASAGSFPIHRVFLAVVLFYMLFVRMDPGSNYFNFFTSNVVALVNTSLALSIQLLSSF